MTYPIDIEGFEGQNLEVTEPGVFSSAKLLIDGEPAPKGEKRGEMLLTRDDGSQVTAKWKPKLMGIDVPELIVGDETVEVAEPLPWYQWSVAVLPLFFFFYFGGFIGALFGILAAVSVLKVFRTSLSVPIQYVVSLATIVACAVGFIIIAAVIGLALF